MEILNHDYGIRSILLEGGANINGSFLKANLIDKISLLIYPGIDGLSGVPSIFEYAGQPSENPVRNLSLNLRSAQTLDGGVVWLLYSVEKNRGNDILANALKMKLLAIKNPLYSFYWTHGHVCYTCAKQCLFILKKLLIFLKS